jgi:hypothetical protein
MTFIDHLRKGDNSSSFIRRQAQTRWKSPKKRKEKKKERSIEAWEIIPLLSSHAKSPHPGNNFCCPTPLETTQHMIQREILTVIVKGEI